MTKHTRLSAFALALAFYSGILFAAKMDLTKAKSQVGFLATGDMGAVQIDGSLRPDFKGQPMTGELKEEKGSVSGKATYQLDSFTTKMGLRDRHMKEKYLEVPKYPEAKLELEPIKLPAGDTAKDVDFKGMLELHGTKKAIAGKMNMEKKDGRHQMQFKWTLKLGDFGIAEPGFMGVTVTELVDVQVAVDGKFE